MILRAQKVIGGTPIQLFINDAGKACVQVMVPGSDISFGNYICETFTEAEARFKETCEAISAAV